MGCDIHVHTEKLVNIHITGDEYQQKWINTDWFKQNEEFVMYPECKNVERWETVDPYCGRDYHLFGILADVRYIEDMIHSMGPRRGIPEDADPLTKSQFDEYNHSPTWFTLKELIKYKIRMKKRKHIGWVPADYRFDPFDDCEDIPDCFVTKKPDVGNYKKIKFNELYPGFKRFLNDVKQKAIRDLNLHYFEDEPVLLKRKLKEAADKYRIIVWFDS